ncbi:hypothetical protein CBR_g24076 [Chara braunii]|uniref:Uncharacterized protein n=1 Tax=Chara braunii TaxID=69332 RepID=A0A388L5P9_CHABU|nr:hypothetical protein CBR_g24076 [Chara braunii]|eukprot:GBG77630.1 hypothetical protein CBR_g24076 [Chara braunii]
MHCRCVRPAYGRCSIVTYVRVASTRRRLRWNKRTWELTVSSPANPEDRLQCSHFMVAGFLSCSQNILGLLNRVRFVSWVRSSEDCFCDRHFYFGCEQGYVC